MNRSRLARAALTLTSLALAACALAAACGGGGGGGNNPVGPNPNPQTIVVEVRDFEFFPKSILVNPGDTVTWRLAGSDKTHTVTAVGGVFDSGFTFTSPGSTFTRAFSTEDLGKTYEYRCTTHHASYMMQGSVRVGESAPPPNPGY
jgi:plastocyanin